MDCDCCEGKSLAKLLRAEAVRYVLACHELRSLVSSSPPTRDEDVSPLQTGRGTPRVLTGFEGALGGFPEDVGAVFCWRWSC